MFVFFYLNFVFYFVLYSISCPFLDITYSNHRTDVKTGVSALSSTSSSFGTIAQQSDGVEESLKQAVLAEEEAVLNQYKVIYNIIFLCFLHITTISFLSKLFFRPK
jgi:hypothetical protein